jgi:hypothetical protein
MISFVDRDDVPLGSISRIDAINPLYVAGCATCDKCGGSGHQLVLRNKLCSMCFRSTKNTPNFKNIPKAYHNFVDITPRADGGVLKKFVSRNEDEDMVRARADEAAKSACGGQLVAHDNRPSHWDYALRSGCPCGVHFVARFPSASTEYSQGEIVGSSRDMVGGKHVGGTDDPVDVMIGRGDVISGIEIALLSMAVGETSLFLIRNDYAWGSIGDGFRVGPNEPYLEYELELIFCLNPLPIMPRGVEVDKQREERQRKERKEYRESVGPLVNRLLDCAADRLTGNILFEVGDYDKAKKYYDAGFFDLLVTKDEWEGCEGEPGLDAQMKCEVNKAKSLLHLNRSLVNLKLDRHDAAKWDADRAIDHHRAAGFARVTTTPTPSKSSGGGGGGGGRNNDSGEENGIGGGGDDGLDMFVCKALFRKGQALYKQAHAILQKDNKEYWDVNKVLRITDDATKCLNDAEHGMRNNFLTIMPHSENEGGNATTTASIPMTFEKSQVSSIISSSSSSSSSSISSPEISQVQKAKSDLNKLVATLVKKKKQEELEWKKVCKEKIIGGLDAANELASKKKSSTTKEDLNKTEDDVYDDMPQLDDSDEDSD